MGSHFSADGNYEVSFMCNALIHHSGEVLWVPPAIYKSSCIIGPFPVVNPRSLSIFY